MQQKTCEASSRCSRSPWLGVLIGALLSLCPAAAGATGAEEDDGSAFYFSAEIIDRPEEAPFFLHAYRSYEDEGALPMDALEAVNIKEWSAFFQGKVPEDRLRQLVYKMKLPELDRLLWTLEGKPEKKLSPEAAALKADLIALRDKDRVVRALYYLGFAKRCEPIATLLLTQSPWETEKITASRARDAALAASLLQGSEGLLAGARGRHGQPGHEWPWWRVGPGVGGYRPSPPTRREN